MAESVLDLVPQTGALQAGLHDLVQLGAIRGQTVNARAVGDVLVDRLRETDWASGTPCRRGRAAARRPGAGHRCPAHPCVIDAGHTCRLDRVVHPVQAAQERRLAAARGPDHRDDLVATDVQAHILDRVLVTVVDVHVARRHDRIVDRHRADGRRHRLRREVQAAGWRWLGFTLIPASVSGAGAALSVLVFSHGVVHYEPLDERAGAYQRRSKRLRSRTASPFITIRNASSTMIAPDVRSTKARSGMSDHR